jgi:hypothetical protein
MPRTAKASIEKDRGGLITTEAKRKNGTESLNGANGEASLDLQVLLRALQAMRVGDFSARLPHHQVGLAGKVADTFNEIVAANERMAQQLEQVGQTVGREGKTRKRVSLGVSLGAWGEMEAWCHAVVDDMSWKRRSTR